jgi:malate synthase
MLTETIEVHAPIEPPIDEILSSQALSFLSKLHAEFDDRRRSLLAARPERRARIREDPTYPEETAEIREEDWTVADVPEAIAKRTVEITGPTDRKMMIKALNSGADVFMADLEDANSPTWTNMARGQVNLYDAVRQEITVTKDDDTVYEVDEDPAELFVRPRGLHLEEDRVRVDGDPVAGSFFDAGLHLFHNAQRLAERDQGPFFYLPKLEGHEEARLWADLFRSAEDELGLEPGTIKATVLLETLPAAFEMPEILYELRDHSAGMNAGRWDYIFSVIKTFRDDPTKVLPDRSQVTMTVPFMEAYTERLVRVCHERGAHAIGGMAAFIPSSDPEVNETAFAEVEQDKQREAGQGFDGTWVAHPALVDVAREPFEAVLDGEPNQIDAKRSDVDVAPEDLVRVGEPGSAGTPAYGSITHDGLEQNVGVGIRYVESWLRGQGAAAIFNLMEDTATAEISRSQVWQWVHREAELDDGTEIVPELVREVADAQVAAIRDERDEDQLADARLEEAREVFEQVALADEFVDFLTQPAQKRLPEGR